MRSRTITQVIGQNVKQLREEARITAKELGARMGAAVNTDGKAWPPQTVYMLESGDRALVAAELVALAIELNVPILRLMQPPAVAGETITSGELKVPRELLLGRKVGQPVIEDPILANALARVASASVEASRAKQQSESAEQDLATLCADEELGDTRTQAVVTLREKGDIDPELDRMLAAALERSKYLKLDNLLAELPEIGESNG